MIEEIFDPENELMGNVVSEPNPSLASTADKLFWLTGEPGYKMFGERMGESPEEHLAYVDSMKMEEDLVQ